MRIFALFLFLLAAICGPQHLLAQDCDHPDFAPLMAFYESTNGDNWTDNTGWYDGTAATSCDPCNEEMPWSGVSCNAMGRVRKIDLTQNELSGVLPELIGSLTEIEELHIGGNNLVGSIPGSIGQLLKLRFFYAANNQLSGEIPVSFANLPVLFRVYLGRNILEGNLPEFVSPSINAIFLDDNNFSGEIPESYTGLDNLSVLWGPNNNLSGEIPYGFGESPLLRVINFRSNNLSGCLPEDLNPFCDDFPFYTVYFDGNPLLPNEGALRPFCITTSQIGAPCNDGIPDNGPDVINEDCSCGDYVPPVVCDHPDYAALEAFYESTNGDEWDNNTGWLTDCEPCQWQGVTCTNGRVTRLILPNNNLNGPLPAEMAALTFLGDVYLLHNKLSGSLPGFFAGNSSLRFLRIGFNEFSGEIPAGLAQIPNLRWLDLQSNNLTGELPAAFGELADLQMLSVRNNQITGTIPVSFAQLDGLTWLDLRSNNLSGCLDEALLALCGGPNVSLGGNPLLPWSGDFHNFCAGFDQVSASCDDGNPQTTNDEIGADCLCAGGTGLAGCADRVGKPCDDGDPKTEGETIQQDCSCGFDGKKSFTGSSRLSNPPLVYPNPTSGIALTVSLPASGMQLRLLSATGREVSRQIALGYITQISVHDLEPGLYLLEIQNQEEHWVRKIIIQ